MITTGRGGTTRPAGARGRFCAGAAALALAMLLPAAAYGDDNVSAQLSVDRLAEDAHLLEGKVAASQYKAGGLSAVQALERRRAVEAAEDGDE